MSITRRSFVASIASALAAVGMPVAAVAAVTKKKEKPKVIKVDWGKPPTTKAVVEVIDPTVCTWGYPHPEQYSENIYLYDYQEEVLSQFKSCSMHQPIEATVRYENGTEITGDVHYSGLMRYGTDSDPRRFISFGIRARGVGK
jgi:hypothetical protein